MATVDTAIVAARETVKVSLRSPVGFFKGTPPARRFASTVQRVSPPEEDIADLPKFGEYVYVEELPEAVYRMPPKYPIEASQAGVTGTVIVQALVDKQGRVRDTRVTRSIPLLDEAAVAAVRQWVFKPALVDNKPVAVWVAAPVRFPR